MKLCKCLILVSALVLMAGAASAQNLLVNGDFETGDLTGWTVSGLSASSGVTVESPDNGPSLPGTHNAFLNNSAQAIGLNLRQSTADGSVGAGLVTFSFDAKLIEANAGGVVFAEVIAEEAGGGLLASSGLLGPLWPWDAWETFGGSFNAPVGTDFLTIRIEAATGANVDSNCLLHVDNVSVESEGAVPVDAATWSGVKALYR